MYMEKKVKFYTFEKKRDPDQTNQVLFNENVKRFQIMFFVYPTFMISLILRFKKKKQKMAGILTKGVLFKFVYQKINLMFKGFSEML